VLTRPVPASVYHDDAEREFAYHTGAERALSEAVRRDWTVVCIKSDFAAIFWDSVHRAETGE
jgi:hypothetical protein